MLRRLAVLLAATLLTLSAQAPAAFAATAHIDERGDAPARWDLRRVSVTNGADRFAVRTTVRDLGRSGPAAFGINIFPAHGWRWSYYLRTDLRRDGSVRAFLQDENATRVRCAVTGWWRPGRNIIGLSVAQSCLTSHRTVRVNAFIGNPHRGDPVDFTNQFRVPRG